MSASPPTDLELVRGLHARDRKALARVYGEHHAEIYNLCARILGDREEAKDVTQEVFLKALASPPAATADVRLRPWLFRVATNTCLNLIRSRRADGLAEPDLVAAPNDPFEQARSAALIEGALGAVNERYRAALVLKDLHGVGGKELAGVLEISRPAADVLVHRARAAFRRAFTDLAGEDVVAPANLAVALPMLAAPAALQALPLPAGPHGGAPGLLPPAVAGAGASAASGAGPAAGVLGKITAALGAKAAVIAVGAAIVAGGSVAVVELTGQTATPAPANTPPRPPSPAPEREAGSSPRTGPCTTCPHITRSVRGMPDPTTASATATTAADTPTGTTPPPEATPRTRATAPRAPTTRAAVTRDVRVHDHRDAHEHHVRHPRRRGVRARRRGRRGVTAGTLWGGLLAGNI